MDKVIINKLDDFGRGLVKINNKVVFVDNVVLGDEVEIEIIQDKKNYSIAKVNKYINISPFRRDFCKCSSKCGGCVLSECIYDKQLFFKKDKVNNVINHNLKEKIEINEIIYSNEVNYRNKITLHVSGKKLGLYKENSNDIVEISKCNLVNEEINKIIEKLKKYIDDNGVNLKTITIKVTNLNEKMICLYGKINKEKFINCFSDIDSIILNSELIYGSKTIKEKLLDYYFLIGEHSFFQVNSFNTKKLYNEIIKNVSTNEYKKVLDLYCGTGTIGICISKYVEKVIGIEGIEDAYNNCLENKKLNNISNIDFILGKVEDHIEKFKNIDLIIVDPPRNGLDKKVINNILRIKPRVIMYVSCDIMTLKRDLNALMEQYNVLELTPVDMFPNTYHVECVSVLHRKSLEK